MTTRARSISKISKGQRVPPIDYLPDNKEHDVRDDLLDVPDGSQVETESWPDYRDATLRFWKWFPEFSVAGYRVILAEPIFPKVHLLIVHLYYALRKAASFVRPSGQIELANVKCDVLLFFHGDKPSVRPPVEYVATRLAERGKTALVIAGDKRAELRRPVQVQEQQITGDEVPGYALSVQNGGSFTNSLYLIGRSLLATFILLIVLVTHRKTARMALVSPFSIWIHMLISARRVQIARQILDSTDPDILLTTNERAPMAAALLASRKSSDSHRILLFSELFTQGLHPILSDEVLVWNRTVERTLRVQDPALAKIPFSVVGNPELAFALSNSPQPNSDAAELRETIGHRPVFLFLVDYDTSNVRNSEVLAGEAHRLVGDAARQLPDWFFILKTRPNHHDIELPGQSEISGIENLVISRGEIELNEFLWWESLRVVAGYSSTGLIVAAGFGKEICRFVLSLRQIDIPLIDDIGTRIHSSDQLVEHLRNAGNEMPDTSSTVSGDEDAEGHFPYREFTLDRILEVIFEDLDRWGDKKNRMHESVVEHDKQ